MCSETAVLLLTVALAISQPPAPAYDTHKVKGSNLGARTSPLECGGILLNEQIAGLERILAETNFVWNLVNSESFQEALRKALVSAF